MSGRQQLTTRTVRAIWWGYAHFVAYALVNSALLVANLVCSPGYPWATWPLLVWSVVLLVHAVLIPAWAGREG